MKLSLLICAALLSACSPNTTDAQKMQVQYDVMKRHAATAQELCDKNMDIAEAYLVEGNEQAYNKQNILAHIDCSSARIGA